ncbi:hypothetical protein MKZ25_08330 [Solibacillus sp. FSL W7-1464]|uniref:hypothetical protein n=1 Tax=Solibacillus sp. FSL W7-1464 TaxID=2921706 RepID=UPI0030F4C730
MKKILLLLTTLSLLVACQSDEGKKAPSGQIVADGKKYELKFLNYEWMEDNLVMRQPNSETIYESLKGDQAIPVKKGDELLLQIEKNPDSVTVITYNENEKQETSTISDNKIIIPSEEDNYFYEMIAEWENGSKVSYVFSVEYTD